MPEVPAVAVAVPVVEELPPVPVVEEPLPVPVVDVPVDVVPCTPGTS